MATTYDTTPLPKTSKHACIESFESKVDRFPASAAVSRVMITAICRHAAVTGITGVRQWMVTIL
jgi:hypothetical protein